MKIIIGNKSYLVFTNEDGSLYGADAHYSQYRNGIRINNSRRVKPGSKIFKMIEAALVSGSYELIWKYEF